MKRNTRKILKYSIILLITLYGGIMLFRLGQKGESWSQKDVVDLQNPKVQDKNKIDVSNENEMVDWHNYEFIEAEKKRTGPAEQGVAYEPTDLDKKEKDRLYSVNGFNAASSRRIAVDRAVPDIRHPGCKTMKYLKKLPTVSIVVPFHNEDNSTLIRTATSAIIRSPDHLIHEIILVDDFSTKDVLKKPLDDYLRKNLPKVRTLRLSKREGLIRARALGAKDASGDVLIFLDSHTEATVNWLPPLLGENFNENVCMYPIAKDKKTVVCPFIDVIDYETFAYRPQGRRRLEGHLIGNYSISVYHFFTIHTCNKFSPLHLNCRSPVMAGGLFAINREWFWTLGGYDEGLDIWGGEQYELSFKIWQCGGQMVDAPCSRVGHIYRKFAPFPNPGIGDFLSRNFKRLIVAWMDEYGEYIYIRKPHLRNVDPGDLSIPFKIRKTLKCKPFKWFMDEVAFDLQDRYPAIEPPDYASGEIRNEGKDLCVDTQFKNEHERFGLEKCMKGHEGMSGEQQFKLSWHKDIRPGTRNVCFDVSTSVDHAPIVLYSCHGGQGNQMWRYLPETKQLYHKVSNLCLDCDPGRKELFMSKCSDFSSTQKWLYEKVNKTALANYDKTLNH
ncbi:putative polypeptide N-acetylgalactosaminyltransferase 10 [Nymphon striatum]|nr:putative polypeptide N-acetylgalactosaminyltransferase 10 [Nymphon striatum]